MKMNNYCIFWRLYEEEKEKNEKAYTIFDIFSVKFLSKMLEVYFKKNLPRPESVYKKLNWNASGICIFIKLFE